MNSGYLNIDNHRCYIGDCFYSVCSIICVETYEHNKAIDIAENLKKLLDANGYTLSRIGNPAYTARGKEVWPAEYGIVIKGVRMEEIMKWQRA